MARMNAVIIDNNNDNGNHADVDPAVLVPLLVGLCSTTNNTSTTTTTTSGSSRASIVPNAAMKSKDETMGDGRHWV